MSLFSQYSEQYPELIKCLGNARMHGRFAHAFLICAPDPGIRQDFSIVLAQIAGCPEALKTGIPDTVCPYCRAIEAQNYSELHTLSPMGKMYQIKVGERVNPDPNTLRHFIAAFHLTSTSVFSRKIGMIFEADRMNAEAQNALLKTLEEPPPETTLILSTGNPSSLLPTTISRCQLIPLPGNVCSYKFSGAEEVFKTLETLCFGEHDLVSAENAAKILIGVANGLADSAKQKTVEQFAEQIKAASAVEDPVFMKRLEERLNDAASGRYMQERSFFLSAIYTFCQQVYLLSQGIDFSLLPNPEVFVSGVPKNVTQRYGQQVLQESEELAATLRFNVPEELALRTFAVNLTV